MRSLLDLLAKIGQVKLTITKNEEGEEDLSKILVLNIQFIEDFAEFYQYNLYKGGKAEIIYVDPLAHKVARALSATASALEVNHKGAVTIDYDAALDELKQNFRLDLKATHFDVLEKKGLFVNRLSSEKGISLQFDKVEFARISSFWSVILEIDKWNEKDHVDMKETDQASPDTSAAASCPQCKTVIQTEHKFCPGCGFKLAA